MKNIFTLFFLISISSIILSQDSSYFYFHGDMPEVEYSGQLGGLILPSEGEIRVILAFVQFPDDGYEINHPAWEKGQPPLNMQGWIDPNWTANPTPNSLTDYFNQMSLGKLKIVGETVSLTTLNTRDWYLQNNWKRFDIHKQIIQQQLDPTWDFRPYDNWTLNGNYSHSSGSDGKIEFIFFIWRNISMEHPEPTQGDILEQLDMYWAGSIGANLQFPMIYVDNNSRYFKANDYGSGCTIPSYFYKDPFRFSIHEFAHYLLGGNSLHNGHAFWAMLSGYEVRSFMINSWERYRLGWCNLTTVDKTTQTISNATLTDFITTGIAYRIEIDANTNQYFYLENHQKLSYWDKCSADEYINDKGIFLFRQDKVGGSPADWLKFIPAEGRFDWDIAWWEPWGTSCLPVFKRMVANRITGNSSTDFHLLFNPCELEYNWFEVIYQEGINGNIINYPLRYGTGKDAFRIGYNEIFSDWSNPIAYTKNNTPTGIGFKINNIIGGLAILDIYVNTASSAPPSKPQDLVLSVYYTDNNSHPKLNWQINLERQVQVCQEGYLIERSINGGTFSQIASVNGLMTQYIDYGVSWAGSGMNTVSYKIRAKNNSGLMSVYSDQKSMHYGDPWKIGSSDLVINEYNLNQNSPNPFNPQTIINYQIPEAGFVTLKIYDILGKEVAILVNENKNTGRYTASFDGRNLASGIYIYSIRVNSFVSTKKMMLVK